MNQSLSFKINKAVATITLNRPKAFNSLNKALAEELIDVLLQCRDNSEIRCIVLTGAGKAFCAGQDLKEVTTPTLNPGFEALLTKRYKPLILLLRSIEKPIIAAVNGVAAGAGANIALACDIVVAQESASFIQAFSKIGLIPDSAGTYFLPRLIGLSKATAIMMLGDKISAIQAKNWGMIYDCVPEIEFQDYVLNLSTKLAQMPTLALGLTKKALNNSLKNDLKDQLDLETKLQIQASESDDYTEGVNAFLEKRKPIYKGY